MSEQLKTQLSYSSTVDKWLADSVELNDDNSLNVPIFTIVTTSAGYSIQVRISFLFFSSPSHDHLFSQLVEHQ